jgi:hypothetical protein
MAVESHSEAKLFIRTDAATNISGSGNWMSPAYSINYSEGLRSSDGTA